MRYALAILTFVPANSPQQLRMRLPAAMMTLNHSGYDGPVYIVDDGSRDQEHLMYLDELSMEHHVIRRLSNGGIARAKNTCLRVLSDAKIDLGFIAEDDISFQQGWCNAYAEAHSATGIHHFSWAWDNDPSGDMRKTRHLIRGYPIVSTSRVNGLFLTFTSRVLQDVGGFKVLPAAWGHEHTNLTKRIVSARLAPFFADIIDSNKFICFNGNESTSAIRTDDREQFAIQNEGPANDLETIFYDLKDE